MKINRIAICSVIFILLSFFGCGTIGNFTPNRHVGRGEALNFDKSKNEIYGGVQNDILWVHEKYVDDDEPTPILRYPLATLLFLIDLPLSIVGDTITLPITIPAQIRGEDL